MSRIVFIDMKKNIYVSAIFALISINSMAQKVRSCANEFCDSVAKITNTQYQMRKLRYEQVLENQINMQKNFRVAADIIRIPVVVHVIHNQINGLIAGSNISDEQIYSQIKVLNEDYRKKEGTLGFNTNPVGADVEIEFFLASIDPSGNPSSGITRHYSSRNSYNVVNDNDRMALSNLGYWDSNKYLNIWVAAFSSGYIGYGEFPFAESIEGLDIDSDERVDGVFIDYTVFGKKSVQTNLVFIVLEEQLRMKLVIGWVSTIHGAMNVVAPIMWRILQRRLQLIVQLFVEMFSRPAQVLVPEI